MCEQIVAKKIVSDFNQARDMLIEKAVPGTIISKKRPASSSTEKPTKKRPAAHKARDLLKEFVEEEKLLQEGIEGEEAEEEKGEEASNEKEEADGESSGQVEDGEEGNTQPQWVQNARAEMSDLPGL